MEGAGFALTISNLLIFCCCDGDISPSPFSQLPRLSTPENEESSMAQRPKRVATRTQIPPGTSTYQPSISPKQSKSPRSPCSLPPYRDNNHYDYGTRRPRDRLVGFPMPSSTDVYHHHHHSPFTEFPGQESTGIPPSPSHRLTSGRPRPTYIDLSPHNGNTPKESVATGIFSRQDGADSTNPLQPTTLTDFDELSTTGSSSNPHFISPSLSTIVSNQHTSTTSTIIEPETPINYCKEGTVITDINLENCPTCKGRCSLALSLSDEAGEKYACSCDSACLVYQDCCPDFEFMCTEEHFQGTLTLNSMSSAPGSKCHILEMDSGLQENFLFINECNGATYSLVDTGGIPNANDGVPVEDLDSGVFFINYDCAKCHGATNLRPMQVTLNYALPPCDDIETTRSVKPDLHQPTTESLVSQFIEPTSATTSPFLPYPGLPHRLRFKFVGKQARECYDGVISLCNESCTNKPLKELCLNSGLLYSMYHYDSGTSTFKNIYCAICNLEFSQSVTCGNIANMDEDYVDDYSDPSFGLAPGSSPHISAFSLSVLFDFDSVSGASSISVICDEDQVLLPNGLACGDIVCPGGFILQNGTCTESHLSPNYTWDFVYQVEVNSSFDCVLCKNNTIVNSDSTISNITNQMTILVNAVSENLSIISVEISCICESLLLSNVTLRVDPGYGDGYVRSNITSSFEHEGTKILLNHLLNYLYEANATVLFSRLTFYAFNLSPATSQLKHICAGYFVSDKDFVITGTDLILQGSGHIYHEDKYILQNGSAFICYEPNRSVTDDPFAVPLAVVTIVLSIMSISCICLRLILQFTTKRYKSAANRMQFQLCLALGISTGLLISTPLAVPNPLICYTVAAIKYFSYMSTFAWMTCVAGDTWWVLKKSESCIQDNPNRSLSKYSLISWLLPLVISGLVFCLDYLPILDEYKPQFGGWACWITNKKGILLYFVTPVSAFIATNITFFILTTVSLRKTFKSANKVRQSTDKSKQYYVYLKLFILMGLTWVIGIIAPWADTPAIWFVFIVLNTSQGIFIFFAFVFELRYLRHLTRKCCHHLSYDDTAESGPQSSSKGTVITTTHTNPSATEPTGS